MTFDPDDFLNTTQPRRTCIANANGVTYPVTGVGTIELSSSLSLSNTLLVPSLSNKLLSVTLLIGAHVPRHHWDDAIVTAVHLINRMPSGVLTFKTPLQVLAQHKPLPSVLVLTPQIFGYVAFVHLHKNQRSKLDPCALRCVFVGYATHQKGYRCYHPPTQRTYVTLDVTFLESELFFHDPSSNSTL
ncbi:unnamed protein product [Prunus brigantina]